MIFNSIKALHRRRTGALGRRMNDLQLIQSGSGRYAGLDADSRAIKQKVAQTDIENLNKKGIRV